MIAGDSAGRDDGTGREDEGSLVSDLRKLLSELEHASMVLGIVYFRTETCQGVLLKRDRVDLIWRYDASVKNVCDDLGDRLRVLFDELRIICSPLNSL